MALDQDGPIGSDGDAARDDTALNDSDPAILHLESAIRSGRHWYTALLEAVGSWTKAREEVRGRSYSYLIGGEAFDWLLLAERLCDAIGGLVPDEEKTSLLFRGQPPLNLNGDEFHTLIGDAKYHQYLNYFYGVTVEEALVLAVEDEVRKERHASGRFREHEVTNEAFRRIYGGTLATTLRHFRRESDLPESRSIALTELKEFAYWRFKYRLKASERAKMASDTRKGLNWLRARGVTSYLPQREPEPESPEQDVEGDVRPTPPATDTTRRT